MPPGGSGSSGSGLGGSGCATHSSTASFSSAEDFGSKSMVGWDGCYKRVLESECRWDEVRGSCRII